MSSKLITMEQHISRKGEGVVINADFARLAEQLVTSENHISDIGRA